MELRKPPYSERQLDWAFAAERRGELPPGTAISWAERFKRRQQYGDQATIIVTEHPAGWEHSKASIQKIGHLIKEGSHNPLVRQVAIRITAHLPSKSPTEEIAAIYQWIRKNIKFRYDPIGMEWLQSAPRTLKERAGDCDCLTVLIGALNQSIGHRVLTRTVGPSKKCPEHVSALIWDKKRWISCDPVLEGPGDTGSNEPGKFAAYAEGPSIIWDLEGKRMFGELGVKPTEQELTLWQFQPTFRQPTEAPAPDRRYSQEHTPVFGALAHCHHGIGYYWLPSSIPGDVQPAYLADLGMWGFLKKIGKVFSKVAKFAAPIASLIPGVGLAVGPALAAAGTIVGGLTKGGGHPGAAPGGAPGAAPGAAPGGAPIPGAAPDYMTPLEIRRVGDSAEAIRNTLQQMMLTQASHGKAIAYLPDIHAAVTALPAQIPTAAAQVNQLLAYFKAKDARELKAKATAARVAAAKIAKARSHANAKRQSDAMTKLIKKVARSEMSRATVKGKKLHLAGLGFRPSLSISFGGLSDINTARAAARVAVDRVNAFTRRVGVPPQVSLPEVRAFQAQDPQLKQDGLYGPNAETAARWYLNQPVPPHSPAFKTVVTWRPPTTTAAAPAAAPAARPTAAPAPRVIHAAPQVITAPAVHRAPSPLPKPIGQDRLTRQPLWTEPKPLLPPPSVFRPQPLITPPTKAPGPIIIPSAAPLQRPSTQPELQATQRPSPIVIPPPTTPHTSAIKHAVKHLPEKTKAKIRDAMRPTKAEIVRLEIASYRGDRALLLELAKLEKSTRRRAKHAARTVKTAQRHFYNGTAGPSSSTAKKKSKIEGFWPLLAVLAFSHNS